MTPCGGRYLQPETGCDLVHLLPKPTLSAHELLRCSAFNFLKQSLDEDLKWKKMVKWQLKQDNSQHMNLALYEDDNIEEVRMIQVAGERSKKGDSTRIEVLVKYPGSNIKRIRFTFFHNSCKP